MTKNIDPELSDGGVHPLTHAVDASTDSFHTKCQTKHAQRYAGLCWNNHQHSIEMLVSLFGTTPKLKLEKYFYGNFDDNRGDLLSW